MSEQITAGEHDLVLSVRGANIVKRVGATTVGELVRFTEMEILEAKCFGETSLNEIREALAKRGLRLGMTPGELRGRPGLNGEIVTRPTPSANPAADHDHEGACCGHCDAAARKLRERTDARRAAGESAE